MSVTDVKTQAPQQQALNELKSAATSPEDHAQIAEWQNEIEQARADAKRQLGAGTVKLVQQPDGSIATAQEVASARDASADSSEVYKGGRR